MSTVDERRHAARKSGRTHSPDSSEQAGSMPPPQRPAPFQAPRPRSKFSPFILLAGLLVSGLLLYYVFSRKTHEPVAIPQSEAADLSGSDTLHEMGSIEALLEYPVLSRFNGDIVWKCEDGKLVEQDEIIVRFETKTVEEDIDTREKEVEDRKQAVKDAQAALDMSRERGKQQIRQQEIAVSLAELERGKIFNHPSADEKQDVELTLTAANLEMEAAQLEARANQELAAQGFVSDAALKKKRQDFAEKKVNFAKARLVRDLTLQGASADSKRQADLAVADAKKRLQITTFNSEADATVLNTALVLANIDLANSERNLLKKRQELERASVRSPVRGRVAFVDVFKGNMKNLSPIQVGETRIEGQDLCKICDISKFRIRVNINEADVHRARIGQSATVTMTAFPGRVFKAVLGKLGVMATDKNIGLSGQGGPALISAGEAFVNVVPATLDFVDLTPEELLAIRIEFTADTVIRLSGPSQPSGGAK
jgi:multidrug resistance efflux pump